MPAAMKPAFTTVIMSELWVVLETFPCRFPALLAFYEEAFRNLSTNQLEDLAKYIEYEVR